MKKNLSISAYQKLGLMALAATLIATLFNNCSDPVFSTIQAPEPASTDTILSVIQNCKDAETTGQLIVETPQVLFEDTGIESGRPGNICQFGVDDNLDMKEGELRARYTQTYHFNLPAGAVLCDMKMNSSVQNFRYDDVFFIMFNGYLLASNDMHAVNNLAADAKPFYLPVTQKSVDLYAYDWLKIRTAPFQNAYREDYCVGSEVGASFCEWPLTEQSGQIQLNFSQEVLIAISAGQPTQTLQFAITGDNDPRLDCYHQKLILDANIKYYIPKK